MPALAMPQPRRTCSPKLLGAAKGENQLGEVENPGGYIYIYIHTYIYVYIVTSEYPMGFERF